MPRARAPPRGRVPRPLTLPRSADRFPAPANANPFLRAGDDDGQGSPAARSRPHRQPRGLRQGLFQLRLEAGRARVRLVPQRQVQHGARVRRPALPHPAQEQARAPLHRRPARGEAHVRGPDAALEPVRQRAHPARCHPRRPGVRVPAAHARVLRRHPRHPQGGRDPEPPVRGVHDRRGPRPHAGRVRGGAAHHPIPAGAGARGTCRA